MFLASQYGLHARMLPYQELQAAVNSEAKNIAALMFSKQLGMLRLQDTGVFFLQKHTTTSNSPGLVLNGNMRVSFF